MVNPSDGVPGYVLHPLDGEALLAVYGYLNPGDKPVELAHDLGWWDDESIHVRGDLDAVPGAAFGVAYRNGLSQPWAIGPTPWTNLADNTQLSGSAIWSGALLGWGIGILVGGEADLAVDLGTLAGQLDFTSLEGVDPSTDDEPVMWGDGDLRYSVDVRGNTFVQTGGDTGTVTGAFFGAGHEGMGGTLERDDLTAAFGGTRE